MQEKRNAEARSTVVSQALAQKTIAKDLANIGSIFQKIGTRKIDHTLQTEDWLHAIERHSSIFTAILKQ